MRGFLAEKDLLNLEEEFNFDMVTGDMLEEWDYMGAQAVILEQLLLVDM